MKKRVSIFALIYLMSVVSISAQGFLHAEGKNMVDGSGENFILRSIGTGNWMLMEGYLMESSGVIDTHTAFRNKLIAEMGSAKTDSFYTSWLNNHFTEADADSLA